MTIKEHDSVLPSWEQHDDSERAWAERGRFLFDLLVERTHHGGTTLQIDEGSPHVIYIMPDGNRIDYMEAVDFAMGCARLGIR